MFLLQKKGDASGEHEKFDERMCIVIQPMKKKYHQMWISPWNMGGFPLPQGCFQGVQTRLPTNGPRKVPPKIAEVNKFVEEIQNILYAKAKKNGDKVGDRGNCYINYKGCSKKLFPKNHVGKPKPKSTESVRSQNQKILVWLQSLASVFFQGQNLHPGRLTWNIKIIPLKRKIIFQTFIIVFHVNLPGWNNPALRWTLKLRFLWRVPPGAWWPMVVVRVPVIGWVTVFTFYGKWTHEKSPI